MGWLSWWTGPKAAELTQNWLSAPDPTAQSIASELSHLAMNEVAKVPLGISLSLVPALEFQTLKPSKLVVVKQWKQVHAPEWLQDWRPGLKMPRSRHAAEHAWISRSHH